ncbi:MAG: ribose-phosphate pyrophosphokinase [Acutalibacteraceae bacterium]|jgi:ribose-phosphate pyrophosphokinase|nr:ribose-phosphate pyrophosphokinase [Clostridiales bacterium]
MTAASANSRSSNFTTIPFGKLGIIALPGCEELGEKIDRFISNWRDESENEHKSSIIFDGYHKDSYLIDVSCPRFGTGEGKAVINQSVRGYDIFVLVDVFNYGVTYEMYGQKVPMSPDDHFANLKRVIGAIGGKAHRITVVMPMLYEGRQHKRSARESLDCALALQELCSLMDVDNVITFDAHDPRVQNAIPLKGFENVSPVYQMIKAFINNVDDIKIDKENLMIVSPDEGGMGRGIYYATVLGVELGMFYKQRDYSRIVNGRNPILAHQFLGDNVKGKDVIVVDDMISSGESMIEVASKLKDLGAKRIFIFSCFGLFCNGLEPFDKAYKSGQIERVFTTNMIYRTPELLEREWFTEVDMSKYIAYIIDALNHDTSVSKLLDSSDRIKRLLENRGFISADN